MTNVMMLLKNISAKLAKLSPHLEMMFTLKSLFSAYYFASSGSVWGIAVPICCYKEIILCTIYIR